jgi:hypothetical protein
MLTMKQKTSSVGLFIGEKIETPQLGEVIPVSSDTDGETSFCREGRGRRGFPVDKLAWALHPS